jgi:cystathionine beta-lyase
MGNSFGSVAMIAAYNSGDDWLKELVEYLEENRKLVIDYVDQLNSSISISPCEGTYLAWLCFKELNIDDETFNGLLKNKARLAVQSGLSFGEEGMGFFRVNFACPRTIINEAMMRIKDLIGDLKHD